MFALAVLLGLAVLVGLRWMSLHNGLVTKRNEYRNAFSQIDVQLKRRYDLIPNLVETAKGYLKHERGTLEAVIAARNAAASANVRAAANPGDPAAMQQLVAAEGSLADAYPDLKANQTMAQLMEELTSTENKVSFARQAYNDSVMVYNTQREVFPSSIIAGMFSFAPAELFVIDKPE